MAFLHQVVKILSTNSQIACLMGVEQLRVEMAVTAALQLFSYIQWQLHFAVFGISIRISINNNNNNNNKQ